MNKDQSVRHCNPALQILTGKKPEEILGRGCWEIVPGHYEPAAEHLFACLDRSKQRETGEATINERYFRVALDPVLDERGELLGAVLILSDITQHKLAELQKTSLIAELQSALGRLKGLGGILPICCGCKRIRDEQGDWELPEVYFAQRAEIAFSHSLCPACAKRLYPEVFDSQTVPETI